MSTKTQAKILAENALSKAFAESDAEKSLNEQIIDSIVLQNKEGFMSAFNAAMAEKVNDALEVKKIEVASDFLSVENTPENTLGEARNTLGGEGYGWSLDKYYRDEERMARIEKNRAREQEVNAGVAEIERHLARGQEVNAGVEKKNPEKKGKEPEKLDEIVRLFRPGNKATVRSIDAYAFQGRDDHPPVDGSLEGHRILITGYGETNGPFGVSGEFDRNPADMRFQSVRGKVLTGQHKGKEFDFINHELLHPQVDPYSTATQRNLAEARVNHREYAAAGLMHPEMANHSSMEVGNMVDFYSSENGDKLFGEVVKNNGEAVNIREIVGGKKGELHKFKVSSKLA